MNWKSVLLILSLLWSPCRGQISTPHPESPKMKHSVFGLGFSGGLASGFGLSFRHHLPSELSYQFIGGVIKVDRGTHYNIGSEIQFDLVRSEAWRFFVDGALGYFFSGDDGQNDLKAPLRFGLGIGAERRVTNVLNIAGELLFTYFSDSTILPLPQLSAHYYFF